jgi:DNA polymerase
MNQEEKEAKLEQIARQVAKCNRCDLYKQATNPVPGEGSPSAKIVFIGEGPGYHEDQRGIPFCGAAGRLLDQLLLSIKVARKDVFIGNMVKHRPPGNRDPLPQELEACQEYLDEQIKIIDPKIIVTLGRFSMRKFLPGEYISKIHGQARLVFFAGKKRVVIPMYHPAAALRSSQVMHQVKEDFEKIPKWLNDRIEEEPEAPKEEAEAVKREQLSLI